MLKLLLLVCVSLSSALADTVQCSSSNAGTFRFSISSSRNQTGGWMVLVDSDRDATPGNPTTLTVDVEHETRSCEDGEHIHLVTVATVEQSTVTSPGTTGEVETVPRSPTSALTAESACREYSKVVVSCKQCFIDRGTALNREPETQVEHKEFPHIAFLGYGEEEEVKWLCDGVLISPRYVLTTAHCTNIRRYGNPRWARFGYPNTRETDPVRPQEFAVSEIILHPDLMPPTSSYDIALLRLEKDVQLNEFVRPACLHTAGDVEGRTGIVTGRGQTISLSPENFKKVEQIIKPIENCAVLFQSRLGRNISSGSVVCVGGERPTCVDQTGGPIQFIRDDEVCMYDIVGLSSFGKPCGTRNSSVVYTRVSYYVPWIEKIVWGTG